MTNDYTDNEQKVVDCIKYLTCRELGWGPCLEEIIADIANKGTDFDTVPVVETLMELVRDGAVEVTHVEGRPNLYNMDDDVVFTQGRDLTETEVTYMAALAKRVSTWF